MEDGVEGLAIGLDGGGVRGLREAGAGGQYEGGGEQKQEQ
jgi:hypothetical protein